MYEKFIELCEKHNKSQTEVLKECGISPSNAANWRNRGGNVRADVLIKLADYFGISVDELLGREKPTQSTNEIEKVKSDHLLYMNVLKLLSLPRTYRSAIYDQIDYQSFRYLNDTKKKEASSAG